METLQPWWIAPSPAWGEQGERHLHPSLIALSLVHHLASPHVAFLETKRPQTLHVKSGSQFLNNVVMTETQIYLPKPSGNEH